MNILFGLNHSYGEYFESKLYLDNLDSAGAKYICFEVNWQLCQVGHNWIVEKSSESTVAVSILLRRVDSPDSVVPVNKAPAPSPPFHYLCVSVWIFCDHPHALSPWLSCIDGDTFLQPEWTDSLWMSLLTYFDPKFRDSPGTGLSGTIFLGRTKVVSSEGALALCCPTLPTDGLPTRIQDMPRNTKTRSSRKQNPVFVRRCVLASPLAAGSAGNALP